MKARETKMRKRKEKISDFDAPLIVSIPVIEKLKSIAKCFPTDLVVVYYHNSKNQGWIASFRDVKEKGDGVLIGVHGYGKTPDEAMMSLYSQILNKTLVRRYNC